MIQTFPNIFATTWMPHLEFGEGTLTTLTATPSGLTVTLTSDTPDGATDYVVYASDNGVDFTLIESMSISGAISYVYSNGPGNPFQMVAGGTYYFKLKYLADEVELGYSTTASATLAAGGGNRTKQVVAESIILDLL